VTYEATATTGPKLHLGCGERYLEGYINIDYPPSEHSVQRTTVADLYSDLRMLKYPQGSVAEIRLHHVFEHFDRVEALSLLIQWREWLEPDGLLVIETPDFQRSALRFLLIRDETRRARLLRHIFGSQEAEWAIHYDGWYGRKFVRSLRALGFERPTIARSSWRGTYNIVVETRRTGEARSLESQIEAATSLLRGSLVDQSESELRLLGLWTARLREGAAADLKGQG
jgi:hypothetical protein